jgi:hypothetical protein
LRLAVGLPSGTHMFSTRRIDDALFRLKELFLAAPGVTLTVDQACEHTCVDRSTCLAVLLALERSRFLRRSDVDSFVLDPGLDDGDDCDDCDHRV